MKERFSKASVAAGIQRRIDSIQTDWAFDPKDGYTQVMKKHPMLNSMSRDNFAAANRAYGEYNALLLLAEDLGLVVDPRGKQ